MKTKKLVLLCNDVTIENFKYKFLVRTVNIDMENKLKYREYVFEKYTTIINQLFFNNWVHLNTILLLLYKVKKIDRLLYSVLLHRVNSLFSFGDFIVIGYNVDKFWLGVLKDINIWYKLFDDKTELTYFCKKHLCQ